MRLPKTRELFAVTAATSALLMTAACGADSEPASDDPTTSAAPSTDTSDTDTDTGESGSYADGTYEGSGSYANPGGISEVDVTITLSGGKISDVEVEPGASSATSLQYQQKFISGIADEIVGKSLDEISVSKVSGSSLTSQGFNQALDQIKADAQA